MQIMSTLSGVKQRISWRDNKKIILALLGLGLVIMGYVALRLFNRYGQLLMPVPGLRVPPAYYVEPEAEEDVGRVGTFAKWSKVEFTLEGPHTSVQADDNPFRIQVDVTFEGPDGQTLVVPAFYDGDGEGGYSGNVWKVRFLPGATGRWHFTTASSEPALAGISGSFEVTDAAECPPYEPGGLPDLACFGLLQYESGQHYLKFADGPYWIKGGIDDPENFIGDAFGGWAEKRAAIDFLRDHGSNSIYFMTNNIGGDRKDTWPWLGHTQNEARQQSDRYDVVKLQEWEAFFEYVQAQGIALHFILMDDSSWHNFDHHLYYREMVARFAHHPALIWNVGEEADEIYRDSEILRLAQMLRDLDPYGHPVTVHRKSRWPFLGNELFDLTSIQPGDGAGSFNAVINADLNRVVRNHRELSAEQGHPIPIMIDETPRVTRVNENTQYIMRSQILYPIYLGGGNFELHFHDAYGQGGSLTIEEMAPMLQEMQIARRLVETMPFHEMEPCNELLSGNEELYCLGKEGESYVLYTASNAPFTVDLSALGGEMWLQWVDPQTGSGSEPVALDGGQPQQLAPPGDGDAAATLSREKP